MSDNEWFLENAVSAEQGAQGYHIVLSAGCRFPHLVKFLHYPGTQVSRIKRTLNRTIYNHQLNACFTNALLADAEMKFTWWL